MSGGIQLPNQSQVSAVMKADAMRRAGIENFCFETARQLYVRQISVSVIDDESFLQEAAKTALHQARVLTEISFNVKMKLNQIDSDHPVGQAEASDSA